MSGFEELEQIETVPEQTIEQGIQESSDIAPSSSLGGATVIGMSPFSQVHNLILGQARPP